jgi:asparagine synthase (glutamine-hydrolysing)
MRFLTQGARYLRLRPSPWRGLRRRVNAFFGSKSSGPDFPAWFAPEFARRLDLKGRWKEVNDTQPSLTHPLLPRAHASLSLPAWSQFFELENPGVTRCAVEVRHPYLDLRIVNYVLALPPFPWAFEKTLLREAMVGHLPESIRRRPKTPLAGDPFVEILQRKESAWLDQPHFGDEIERYVDRSALPTLCGERDSERAAVAVRPICLNFWLQSARRVRYNLNAEVCNG